jgi:hypothetical protein
MPDSNTEPRVRPTLHPLAYTAIAGLGLLLVLMVVGIAMLVVILKDSRDHIRAQDKKTAVLLQKVQAAEPTAEQVPGLLDQARPVVRRLGRAVGPVQEAIASTAEATERLPMLVAELARVLPETRAAVQETPPLIRQLLHVQLVTLDVQRQALRVQLETLSTQREALRHIESIDRKTGGTVPTQGAPVPQP